MIRPINPKVKTILKVAIPLAVVAFVLFIWASARPVPIQVRVTFTGYTNLGTLFPITEASFCVSNAGRGSVCAEGVNTEIKNQPYGGFFNHFWLLDLKPGEFKTVSLEPPTEIDREPTMRVDNGGSLVRSTTNLEPWRLSLSFSKVDWRDKLDAPGVLRKVLQFIPAKWLERHTIEVHSDWINGSELMPVATSTTNAPPK